MTTTEPMQLGMVGLGRMGANLVQRLVRDGHRVRRLRRQRRRGRVARRRGRRRGVVARGPRRGKLARPARGLADAARRDHPDGRSTNWWRTSRDDVVIDGGNSFYQDDIDRARATGPEGHPLRRLRHERRRLGTRARLQPHDRGRGRRRRRDSTRSLGRSLPVTRRDTDARAHAATAPRRRATCTADPTARATSSRWCTTASSTA